MSSTDTAKRAAIDDTESCCIAWYVGPWFMQHLIVSVHVPSRVRMQNLTRRQRDSRTIHFSDQTHHSQQRPRQRGSGIEEVCVSAPDVEPTRAPLRCNGIQRFALLHTIGTALNSDADAVVVVEGQSIPTLGHDAKGVRDGDAKIIHLRVLPPHRRPRKDSRDRIVPRAR